MENGSVISEIFMDKQKTNKMFQKCISLAITTFVNTSAFNREINKF